MNEVGGQVVPPYMIATKEAVKERAEPVWTRRKNLPNVTESYHNYMTNEILRDFAMSVAQVSTSSLQDEMEHSTSIPSSSYEFPNGYNLNVTVEKFKITEGLFNAGTANLKVTAPSLHTLVLTGLPRAQCLMRNMYVYMYHLEDLAIMIDFSQGSS
jgi:hypothetical protein